MSGGAPKPKVIAVDGPAASGKGTIGRRLAQAYGFAYLDTGLLYRATAARVLAAGISPADAAAGGLEAAALTATDLARDDLRSEATGRAASQVAKHPQVRAALLDYQRQFATQPPDGKAGAVLDGRDIGTVICPDADAKLFVTASAETRARRRHAELSVADPELTYEAVLADLRDRDARDSARDAAPMRRADDADLLDTTDLGIEAAFEAAYASIRNRLGPAGD